MKIITKDISVIIEKLNLNIKLENAVLDNKNIYCNFNIEEKHKHNVGNLQQQINHILTKSYPNKNLHIAFSNKKNQSNKIAPNNNNIKNVVLVSSCKGGVGKSTISANIALALAKQGLNTGLLDADIQGPSIPTIFNIQESKIESQNGLMLPVDYNGIKIISMGFLLKNNQSAFLKSSLVNKTITQMVNQTLWGELDILLIDMPPGTGDIYFKILELLNVNCVILVSTAQDLAMLDTARSFNMFEKLGINILGLINNMAYFKCPCCNKQTALFKQSKHVINIPTLASLEFDENTSAISTINQNNKSYNFKELNNVANIIKNNISH